MGLPVFAYIQGDADISRLVTWSSREDKIVIKKLGVLLKNAIGAKLSSYTIRYRDVSVDLFTWRVYIYFVIFHFKLRIPLQYSVLSK